jgi:hypothetical protein
MSSVKKKSQDGSKPFRKSLPVWLALCKVKVNFDLHKNDDQESINGDDYSFMC